ncbi:MAG TPA: DinB family protein [Anaerolineales bacterium]|nr:DinB family protein [Anaerolineales bacterium]
MNAAEYFDHWDVVQRDLMRGVSMLKDAHLDFRPSETYPRTVGGILRHIINLQQGWVGFVVRRDVPAWPDENALGRDVASLRSDLERVHKETMAYLATVPMEDLDRIVQVPGDGTPMLGWILWHVLEQVIHHRGELFLCLSLLGMGRPKIDRPE